MMRPWHHGGEHLVSRGVVVGGVGGWRGKTFKEKIILFPGKSKIMQHDRHIDENMFTYLGYLPTDWNSVYK